MPIYEYHCRDCNEEFEITQKITEAPLHECPRCQGSLEKLISQSSFVLKGSGWYATDYARKKTGQNDKPAAKEGASCAQSGTKPACSGCPSAAD